MIYALVIYILTPVMVTKGVQPIQIIVSNTIETEAGCKEQGQELIKPWIKAESQAWPICYPGPDTRTPQEKEKKRKPYVYKHPGNIGDIEDPVKIGQSLKITPSEEIDPGLSPLVVKSTGTVKP